MFVLLTMKRLDVWFLNLWVRSSLHLWSSPTFRHVLTLFNTSGLSSYRIHPQHPLHHLHLSLWYRVMSQISSFENPTNFIVCQVLITLVAAATMPDARNVSSSLLSWPSKMFVEEINTVLAHVYPSTDESQLVYNSSLIRAPKFKDSNNSSSRHFCPWLD